MTSAKGLNLSLQGQRPSPGSFLSTLVQSRGNSCSFVSASSGYLPSFFTPFSKTPSTILVVDEKRGHILNLTSTGEACMAGGLTNSETCSNHTGWSEMNTSQLKHAVLGALFLWLLSEPAQPSPVHFPTQCCFCPRPPSFPCPQLQYTPSKNSPGLLLWSTLPAQSREPKYHWLAPGRPTRGQVPLPVTPRMLELPLFSRISEIPHQWSGTTYFYLEDTISRMDGNV